LSGLTIGYGQSKFGGGICGGTTSRHARAYLRHVIVGSNAAENSGGGIAFFDGPILNSGIGSNWTLGESPEGNGGGLYQCHGPIRNSSIGKNKANNGGGLFQCHGIIEYNTITENSADRIGGGLALSDGPVQNNTIVGNWAHSIGGGLVNCKGTVQNCIIWGNRAFSHAQLDPADTSPIYCCIQDWTGGGEGNTDMDPKFVDRDRPDNNPATYQDNNYRVIEGSRCIDRGKTEMWMWSDVDLDGNPRVIGDAVDMGAYETNYIEVEMNFTPKTLNCSSRGKWVKAHIVLPEEFLPEDIDVSVPAWAEPIDLEYIKVLGSNPVKLEIGFIRQVFCEAVTKTDEVEITITGSLTTGQYFYGSDTIKLIDKNDRKK